MQKRIDGTTVTIPVPLHNPIRRGTLLSVIRQSHLPRSLFESGE
jgi:predicted RNA binding protein YcfA (HicA-like mRNA interferase family)